MYAMRFKLKEGFGAPTWKERTRVNAGIGMQPSMAGGEVALRD